MNGATVNGATVNGATVIGIENYEPLRKEIKTLAEIEKTYILRALVTCHFNRTITAKALGVSIRGLRNKLNEYRKAGHDVPRANAGPPFKENTVVLL